MFLVSSVPPVRCLLNKKYLYNTEDHDNEWIECVWVAVRSEQGRALKFSVVTNQGVCFNGIPINAFIDRPNIAELPLDMCQLWDNFSYDISVQEVRWLKGKRCQILMKDKTLSWGTYLFSICYCNSSLETASMGYGEDPDVKDAHVVLLDSGHFVAQPNNRIIWHDFDFITDRLDLSKAYPDYKVLDKHFYAEHSEKWKTVDSKDYIYKVEEDK